MSKILEMLEADEKSLCLDARGPKYDNEGVTRHTISGTEMWLLIHSQSAIPDIKRIVEWANSMGHAKSCRIDYPSEGTVNVSAEGKFESMITRPGQVCTCGLSEIQSLIRR